jgi:hypothetical protein
MPRQPAAPESAAARRMIRVALIGVLTGLAFPCRTEGITPAERSRPRTGLYTAELRRLQPFRVLRGVA